MRGTGESDGWNFGKACRYWYAVESKPVKNTAGKVVHVAQVAHRFTSPAAREAWLDEDPRLVATLQRVAVDSAKFRRLLPTLIVHWIDEDGNDYGRNSDPEECRT